MLGDGEEVVGEITEVVRRVEGRRAAPRARREQVLRRAGRRCPGVYVPSMYEVAYDGADLVAVTPRYPDVPAQVEKRTVADLADWPYPKRQLVPLTEVVHDRLNVEVFRGCTRGCRFCQAGMITRPVRERPADQVRTMVAEGLRRTGYDEVSAHVAVDRRLLAASSRSWPTPSTTRPAAARSSVSACRRCGSTPSPSASPPQVAAGPPHRAHVRARGRHVAACAR